MKYCFRLLMIVALVAGFAACSTEGDMDSSQPQQPIVEGELLVKFSPDVAEALAANVASRSGAVTRSGAVSVDRVMELVDVFEIEPVFPAVESQREVRVDVGLERWYVVRFGGDYTAEEVAAMFEPLGEVQKIDFNRTIKRAYTGKATPLSVERFIFIQICLSLMVYLQPKALLPEPPNGDILLLQLQTMVLLRHFLKL